MKEDRSKGIDGHNPSDQRREQLKNKYLVKYNVDSLKQLPINFDGIVMQEDEEYGNRVWDKHFGNNYSSVQISAQFITSNQLRIFTSAPFWGKVHYMASS